jgi:ankyrin repeat protein
LQKGYDDELNDYRGLDAFNISALYALGYGVPQDYDISFKYLKAASSLSHQPAMFYCRAFVDNGLFSYDTSPDSVLKHSQDFEPSMPQELHASHQIRTTHLYWCNQSVTSATIRGHCIPLTGVTLEKLLEIADIDNVHKLEVELDIDGDIKQKPLLHHLLRSDQQLFNILLRKGAVGLSRAHNSDSLLHVACESGSTKLVNTLLELHPELARYNHTQGISPLHWLFMFEDSDIPLMAKVLAGRGASTTRVGVRFLREANLVFSGPPIHWAIMARNACAVQAMIDLGVDLNKYSTLSPDVMNYPRYTIDVAASLLMPEMVQLLADHGALLSNRKKLPATTAIGHVGDTVDAFRLWLYHGKDVGKATQKTIKVLLDCGAVLEEFSNETKRDNYTWTTCFPSVLEQFLLFEPKVSKVTVRFAAISLQHDPFNSTKLSMILDYCAAKMDEDLFLEACSLSLPLCIRDGSLSAVEAILSRLGDATGAIIDEQNLIHMAANTDHPNMIKLLVSYGGDINLDEDGTAAGTAAMYSKRNALKYLLSHGAILTGGDCTILHDIVSDATPRYESEKTLEMMCDCFRDLAIPIVNEYDSRGFTALHEAILWGNVKNVSRLMVYLNADGRNIDGTDVSPLYLVALLQEHPPWVILQQGERNINNYRKSLEAISDYLQNTMGLVPPESIVEVPEIMRFWTLPRLSVWRPVDRLSEWYRSFKPRKTVGQGGWWGV